MHLRVGSLLRVATKAKTLAEDGWLTLKMGSAKASHLGVFHQLFLRLSSGNSGVFLHVIFLI